MRLRNGRTIFMGLLEKNSHIIIIIIIILPIFNHLRERNQTLRPWLAFPFQYVEFQIL